MLALASLAVVPFLFLWIRWSARQLRPTADCAQVLESRLTARLHESFAAIRLVKTYAREPYEGRRFVGAATDAMDARVVLTRREAWFSLVIGNLIVLGASLVLSVGGRAVLDGRLSVGTLLIALAYLGFVYGPLSGIANTMVAIQQALASARRVREMSALATEVDDGSASSPGLRGHTRFERVAADRPHHAGDRPPAVDRAGGGSHIRLAAGRIVAEGTHDMLRAFKRALPPAARRLHVGGDDL